MLNHAWLTPKELQELEDVNHKVINIKIRFDNKQIFLSLIFLLSLAFIRSSYENSQMLGFEDMKTLCSKQNIEGASFESL